MRMIRMTQQLIGQTPGRSFSAKFANPSVQFGTGAESEVLDQQLMRELLPMSPSREEKSLSKFVKVGCRKESARATVGGDFGQHAINMIKRNKELIA